MELFIILCLCLLASSKVTLQGMFARKNIITFIDGIFFNGIIFFFAAFIFLTNAIRCHTAVVAFGSVFGLLTMLFQLCYIKAMTCGSVSMTVLLVNLSMIIPVITSVAIFDENLTGTKILGLILTIIALTISIDRNEKSENSKKWFLLSALSFLLNGGLAVTQQIFGKTVWKDESTAFVAWSYIIATILSLMIYLLLKFKGKNTTFKIKPSVLGIGLSIGVILGAFQLLNTKAIATIDGLLLFPFYNGGTLILSYFFSIFFLKDKLKIKQIISIIIGIFAIIFINL